MIVLPFSGQFLEQRHDLGAGAGVEVPGRLVGQKNRRFVDERARDRNTLALAAGKFVGLVMHPIGEADQCQVLPARSADARGPARPRK